MTNCQGGPGISKTTWGRFFWLRLSVPLPPTCLPNKVCFFHASFEENSGCAPGGP